MDLLTLGFLLFCIVLVIVYYLVPKAMQWWILLAASLVFLCHVRHQKYDLRAHYRIVNLCSHAHDTVFNRPPERMDQSQQKDNQ